MHVAILLALANQVDSYISVSSDQKLNYLQNTVESLEFVSAQFYGICGQPSPTNLHPQQKQI